MALFANLEDLVFTLFDFASPLGSRFFSTVQIAVPACRYYHYR